MKSLDDVIKALEMCTADNCDCLNGCPYSDLVKGDDCCDIHAIPEMQKDALQWLKGYQQHIELDKIRDKCEAENSPLSWEQLSMMIGLPVWVEYNFQIGNKEFRDKSKRWCIIREFKPWHDTEIIITENGFVLSKNEQVKDWQAYLKEHHE